MGLYSTLDRLHFRSRHNKWMRYFTVVCRIGLAWGFLPSGIVKIMGERFTSLSVNHPMGHYLQAFYETGFYYPFVGVMQVIAALLLLIPRTATLGAIIYLPIILNICILSLSVRFEGSSITSPLMVLANLYLLCWDYDKWRRVLPFYPDQEPVPTPEQHPGNRFPILFFAGVAASVAIVVVTIRNVYVIRPRNTLSDCQQQCKGSNKSDACYEFCDCIHEKGQPIDDCVERYKKAPEDPRP